MRRVDFLITDIRRIGKNEANPDGTVSITDEEILRYINDSQDRLQGLISSQHSTAKIFIKEELVSAVANQDGYSLIGRCFYNKSIENIEFSATGNLSDYVLIKKLSNFNRDTNVSNYPDGYYTRFGKFYPVPVISVSQGTFRVMYEGTLDDIDKRRGKISAVTGLTSTGFTSITLDSTADETSTPNLSTIDYICINSPQGVVRAYNIPVSNYNTGTNVLTPDTFTFAAGESILVGDYVTFGKWSTTHAKGPDETERYYITYAAKCLLQKDSSNDLTDMKEQLENMEADITKSVKFQTGEIQNIPQVNEGEWWLILFALFIPYFFMGVT